MDGRTFIGYVTATVKATVTKLGIMIAHVLAYIKPFCFVTMGQGHSDWRKMTKTVTGSLQTHFVYTRECNGTLWQGRSEQALYTDLRQKVKIKNVKVKGKKK